MNIRAAWRKPLLGGGLVFLLVCTLVGLYRTGQDSLYFFEDGAGPSNQDNYRRCVRVLGTAQRRRQYLRKAETLKDIWELLIPRALPGQLALKESLGLWCEDNHRWTLRKARFKRQSEHQRSNMDERVAYFFNHNWEPDIGCALEERLGNIGDGGKWVCDPPAIAARAQLLRDGLQLPYRCVVYSFGSNNDFSFELAVQQHLPDCEIFVFDPISSAPSDSHPEEFRRQVHFFRRALGAAESNDSLAQVMSSMGHLRLPYVIEVLKIDIERGEFPAFLGAFRVAEKIHVQGSAYDELSLPERCALQTWEALRLANQVLIEVHGWNISTTELDEFFYGFRRAGFGIFHKEPNLAWCCGECIEYGFLRLHDAFFQPEFARSAHKTPFDPT